MGAIDVRLRTAWWSLLGALEEFRESYEPSSEMMNAVWTAKHHVTLAATEVVDQAMELAGGSSFYRTSPLERAYRDVRAGKYHPLTPELALVYAGRVGLGCPATRYDARPRMVWMDRLSPEARRRLKPRGHPEWINPMLATLSHEIFSGAGWVFERKLDGERCLGFRFGDRLRLLSRNGKLLNETYPEVVDALSRQRCDDFVVDGEVVAFEGALTSFALLQQRMHVRDANQARASQVPVFYYLFDLPYIEGHDLTELELLDRKALLKDALSFFSPLRYTAHRHRNGAAYHRQACADRWEGLIAKRAASVYVQARSRDWLKFKCVNEQEFVIVGFTDPQGSRQEFGALLVGYYEDGGLAYAGKVGTGYNDRILREVGRRLRSLEVEEPTLQASDLPRRGVHWVRPELVAQIGYTEMTRDGRLRHPRFLGLRDDKSPRDVVLERPS